VIRAQWSQQVLDRSLLKIDPKTLRERLARVKPLILREDRLYSFDIPGPEVAFNISPVNLVEYEHDRGYHEVTRSFTQHTCAYYGFFKPSLKEVMAQMPDDPGINAFYLDGNSVAILHDGEGHICTCHWLTLS
jgi:hypothetical protein